ncbi:MAG: S1C family serine protease [Actinomycetota bacterium]|nr:S1C family serine protease [Actinomycetota bacterium]
MDQPTHENREDPVRVGPSPPFPVRPTGPPPGGQRSQKRRSWATVLVPFASGLLGVALGIGALFAADVLPAPPPVTVVRPEVTRTEVVRTEPGFRTATQIAQQVIPSIVEVRLVSPGGGEEDDILNNQAIAGSGSGVVFRADGYVVTNQHVVGALDDARLQVIFADGRIYPAEAVGTDPHTDLAVLQIPASDLSTLEPGSTETSRIGDPAIAVGNPLGLEGGPSLTVGVISAFARTLRTPQGNLFGMIQTDAPITRGSSGGALVDPDGRLLGITTAIGVTDVGAEGLGFAVPVEVVEEVVQDLIENGKVEHAFLGMQGVTAFQDSDDGAQVPAGAEVVEFLPGSALQQAGARAGDVIVALEGQRIETMDELVVELRHYRAGEEVGLQLQRRDELLTIDVVLDRRPEDL